MRGTPADMQRRTVYDDTVRDIMHDLAEKIDTAVAAGIDRHSIIVDPGIGFAKTTAQNFEILKRLSEFKALNCPLCIGVSRKSFIGDILGDPDPGSRLPGTIASCVVAALNGADIVRVHDVKEVKEAVTIIDSIKHS